MLPSQGSTDTLVKRIAFVLATPTIDIQPQRCHLWLLQSRVKSSSEGFCWVQQQRWPWEPSSPIWLFSETTDVGKSVNSLVHGFKCPLTRWCCTENVWAHRTRAQRITTDVHRNPHTVKKKTSSCLVIPNFISVLWAVEKDRHQVYSSSVQVACGGAQGRFPGPHSLHMCRQGLWLLRTKHQDGASTVFLSGYQWWL